MSHKLSRLPLAMPTTASQILGTFIPRDRSGLHALYPASPRQVALAEFLADCARERLTRP